MGVVTRFPDTLELARAALESSVGVRIGTRLPETWPATGYVQIARTGGTRTRLVDDAVLDVEVYHRSPASAERIAGEIVSHTLALEGVLLDGWQVLSTSNPGGVAAYPDPRFPDMPRAIAKIGLRVRGVTTKE